MKKVSKKKFSKLYQRAFDYMQPILDVDRNTAISLEFIERMLLEGVVSKDTDFLYRAMVLIYELRKDCVQVQAIYESAGNEARH